MLDKKINKNVILKLIILSQERKKVIKSSIIIRDMFILFLFFGNDFIPHLNNIKIDEFNIDILFYTYIENINKYKINIHDDIEKN